MNPADTEALKALVALAAKATEGPWELNTTTWHNGALLVHVGHGEGGWSYIASLNMNMRYLLGRSGEQQAKDNAAFLIAARNAIPAIERMLASQTQEPLQKITELAGIALATVVKGPDEEGEHWCSMCDAMLEDETTGHKATCASRVLRDIYEIASAAAPVASQMGEPQQALSFIAKHHRQVQASPGVGKERQDYAIACLDDLASDIERHMVARAPAAGMDADNK